MTEQGRLLFVHGWGFGPEVWDQVRAELPDPGEAVDLGYGGAATVVPEGSWVGVGHSFGVPWLLRHVAGLRGLVSVNGFVRFGASARVMARMRRRLGEAPGETLDAFRLRCGAGPWLGRRDDARLASDLAALAACDEGERLQGLRLLTLAAADDPLVAIGEAPGLPVVRATGGHVLPMLQPAWVAAQILEFMA